MESPSIGPTKGWVVVASLVVFAQLVLALSMKSSYPLTTFGDTSQCILLLGALLSVIPIAFQADGRTRIFGWLMSLGFVLWFSAQVLWTYFEVYRRQQTSEPISRGYHPLPAYRPHDGCTGGAAPSQGPPLDSHRPTRFRITAHLVAVSFFLCCHSLAVCLAQRIGLRC